MGTRGAFGFRIDGQDKVTYNHYDSYPSGLGENIVRHIVKNKIDHMKNVARSIKMVNADIAPTPEEIDSCLDWADLGVGDQKLTDWYCLLREAQNSLDAWLDDGLRLMIDSQEFLLDGIFCEYAYIINLDEETLEFYTGFQKEQAPGRYCTYTHTRTRHDGSTYVSGHWGVGLMLTIPLAEIRDVDAVVTRMCKIKD